MENLNIIRELHITSDSYYGTYVTYVIYGNTAKHFFTEKEDLREVLNELETLLKKELEGE